MLGFAYSWTVSASFSRTVGLLKVNVSVFKCHDENVYVNGIQGTMWSGVTLPYQLRVKTS